MAKRGKKAEPDTTETPLETPVAPTTSEPEPTDSPTVIEPPPPPTPDVSNPTAQQIIQQVADNTQFDADSGEPDQPKKKWAKPPNPHGFEGRFGKANGVHLLKSEPEEAGERGAWVIRFDVPPNEMEGYGKENPHPVLAYLKSEGYRWGFDQHDDKGGWGKVWQGDAYGVEHDEARKVLAKAAEMVGAAVSQGVGSPG